MNTAEKQNLIAKEMERFLTGDDMAACSANFEALVNAKADQSAYKELILRYRDAKAAYEQGRWSSRTQASLGRISVQEHLRSSVNSAQELNDVKMAIFSRYAEEIDKKGEAAVMVL